MWDYYNTGGSDLEVTAVTFSDGPFSLSTESTLPVITTSGGIGSFDVVFSPPADIDASISAGGEKTTSKDPIPPDVVITGSVDSVDSEKGPSLNVTAVTSRSDPPVL